MTTKRVVYTKPGGTVSVLQPMDEAIDKRIAEGMTEDEAIADIQAKDVPLGGFNAIVIEFALLPDRIYRDAWSRVGPSLPTVAMPKARTIHSGRISKNIGREIARLKLSEQAAALDGRTADAANDLATRTGIESLNLAIIATQIANAATPNALKAIWPANVPGKP